MTTATDVYALGLVLYVLLTGAHPLGNGARSTPELIDAVLNEETPRPSTAASGPISTRRALEGDLDTILGKALKKDPAERYASVAAFAEDLRRFLAHEPISARPDTVPYRVTKFVRRKPRQCGFRPARRHRSHRHERIRSQPDASGACAARTARWKRQSMPMPRRT